MKILLVSFLWLLPNLAWAIINIEREGVDDGALGREGTFQVSVNGQSGNSETVSAELGARIHWRYADYSQFVAVSAKYGESAGETNADQTFLHLRHIQGAKVEPLAWEVFAQLERDEFRDLNVRALLGAGVRRNLWRDLVQTSATLGLGGFYSFERYDSDPDEDETRLRANSYFALQHQLSEQTSVSSTTYVQPRVTQLSDLRVLQQTALTVALAKQLALKVSLDIMHDSEPPRDVEATDVVYKTTLVFEF